MRRVVVWIVFQSLPWNLFGLHHPLWDRAAASLRRTPEAGELFAFAADAAVLLYAAAWFLEATGVTTAEMDLFL